MGVTHRMVSEVTDEGTEVPDLVGPNEWNDTHLGGTGVDAGYLRIADDIFTVAGPWAGGLVSSLSGGTISQATSLAGHPGIGLFSTSTSSTGRAAIISGTASGFIPGDGILRFGSIVRVGSQGLSTSSERYKVESGFGTGTSAGGGNGPQFSYTDNVNSGNWTAESRTSGSDSAVDTGVAVAAATWYKLELEINAAASEIKFWIDGTLEHTETTNIETGIIQMVPFGIFKSVGTTLRTFLCDAFWYEWIATTER